MDFYLKYHTFSLHKKKDPLHQRVIYRESLRARLSNRGSV